MQADIMFLLRGLRCHLNMYIYPGRSENIHHLQTARAILILKGRRLNLKSSFGVVIVVMSRWISLISNWKNTLLRSVRWKSIIQFWHVFYWKQWMLLVHNHVINFCWKINAQAEFAVLFFRDNDGRWLIWGFYSPNDTVWYLMTPYRTGEL